MHTETIVEISGWLGVVFYVLAYLLLSAGIFRADTYWFHFLNILGATGLITDSAFYNDKPNLVVNTVWLIIGIFAMAKRYFRRSVK